MKNRIAKLSATLALLAAGGGVWTAACSTSDATCAPDDLTAQPSRRVSAGSTFFLPQKSSSANGAASCAALRWELTSAPANNAATVTSGADGFDRLTPTLAGTYQFRASGTSFTRTLTVVPSASAPFENYPYYPSSSIAVVGTELWVADTFDPNLTRIDPATKAILGQVPVGPFPVALAHRPGMKYAVVAQRAGDTLGFVDVERREIVDSVWVGDEPGNVVLSPDGKLAYVSLATQGAVAIVNVETRTLEETLTTNFNPLAMALTEDGRTLFVASYRSGVGDRNGKKYDERSDLFDIAVVDTASRKVTGYIESVGSVLNGMLIADGRLYVTTTRVDLQGNISRGEATPFHHTVAAYDVSSRKELVAVDLGRQPSSTGLAVRAYGLTMQGGRLWVAAEGSDVVVGLDPTSLEEKARFAAPGRPRALVAVGNGIAVHGAQAYRVTFADGSGAEAGRAEIPGDPRTPTQAAGQAIFSGTGGPTISHSCTDCHLDGLTDGNYWRAGIKTKAESRPLFWLEGTNPIGWNADGVDLASYLYSSSIPTITKQVDNESYRAMVDFFASLVPPPPANGRTTRDGSMTEAARRGQAVFEGKAGCLACHSGELRTNRLRSPQGTEPEPTDTPSLIGIYRYGYWLLPGNARTIGEAVDAMLPLARNPSLSTAERDDLIRYLEELTARDFLLLGSTPEDGAKHVASSAAVALDFTHALLLTDENLKKISLHTAAGAVVDAELTASNRKVVLKPKQPLASGGEYEVRIDAGLEAWGEQRTPEAARRRFTVAGAPGIRLEGDYVLVVKQPRLDVTKGAFDKSVLVDVTMSVKATPKPSGATVTWDITPGLKRTYDVVIDGQTSYWPALSVPAGLPLLWNGTATSAPLVDENNDGIADRGAGTLSLRSPGLEADDVAWQLTRGAAAACDTASGNHKLVLSRTPAGLPVIAWDGPQALGYYVTEPSAKPPAGPGAVTGGKAYWVLQTTAFPDGFEGPITYGVAPKNAKDSSDANGAPLGGGPLPTGQCVKFTATFKDFTTSTLLTTW